MAIKESKYILTAEDRTRAAFNSLERNFNQTQRSINQLKSVLGALGTGVSIAGVIAIGKAIVDAASLAEQSSNRLNAVIKATGDTSGFTRAKLDEMTDALTRATTFDDESIRNAQANLMKFGALHGETFTRALKLSADYAAFTDKDMVAATQLIGKALADPVRGVTQLGKALGTLTTEQETSIKKFIEQGRVAEAQEIIFNKLEKSIGGTAGAMNTGLFGATTATTKAWDDLMEAMGRTGAAKLVIESSLNVLTNLLAAMKEKIEGINKETQRMIDAARGQLQPLEQKPWAAVGPGGVLEFGGQVKPGALTIPRMTVEEVDAAARANIAEREAGDAARAEAAAKKEADLIRQRAKSREEIAAETYKRWQNQMKEHLKLVEDMRKKDFDNAVETGSELRALFEADLEARAAKKKKQLEDDIATRDQLYESLYTEQDALRARYEKDFDALNDLNTRKNDKQFVSNEEYYILMGALVTKYEKDKLAIETAQSKESQKIWDNFVQNVQRTLGDQLYNVMQGNFDNIGQAFSQMLQRMLADALAANLTKAIFGGGVDWVGLGTKLLGLGGTAGGATPAAQLAAGVIPMAAGGDFMVTRPTLFLAGEAGPERATFSGGNRAGGGREIKVNYSPVINVDSRTDRNEVLGIVEKGVRQGNADLVERLSRAGAI